MAASLPMCRRAFGSLLAGAAALAALGKPGARAAAPDGAGAVNDMLAALQASRAWSFTTQSTFDVPATKDALKTVGSRASVVFARPDNLFVVFGGDGAPDVQLLMTGGEATLYRLSLAAKTVLKLAPENGAAFMVPGLFIPFLGLLADSPEEAFFGGINSVTPIAQGLPDQPEQTSLDAVMGSLFTGEVWVDKSTSLPARVNGTWFASKGSVTPSAAVSFTGWSPEAPDEAAFSIQGLAEAKRVELTALGL